MYEIKNDRLLIGGLPARFEPTEHVGGRIEAVAIAVHDTAGGPPGDSVGWLRKNPKKVSAHAIIKTDGTVIQLADFDRKTNHAGELTWNGVSNCNGRMIGIELQNPGHLRGKPNKAVSEFGRVYGEEAGVVAHPATQWHQAWCWMPYPEAQLRALEQMIGALGEAYPTIVEVVGHHHISPGRKDDPTPLMPWERIRAALVKRGPAQPPPAIVKEAQLALIDLGYHLVGTPDGHMGPRTRAAI